MEVGEKMNKPSGKYSLNLLDYKSQAKSAVIFLAPALVAFLVALTPLVQSIVPVDQKQAGVLLLIVWALNQLTGLLRKFVSGK